MSARQAFVPTGSRPASRSAQPQEQQNHQKAAPQFTIDRSNPLHGVSNPAGQTPSKKPIDTAPQTTMANTGSNSHGSGDNRPLNTGSLMKRQNPAQQNRVANQNQNPAARRPSIGRNVPMRPGTADPHSTSQQEQNQISTRTHIAAPVPRPAARPSSPGLSNSLASSVFTSGNPAPSFRMPALPLGSTPQASSEPQPQMDAHIPSSAVGFSFSNPHATSGAQQQQKSQLPSPPNSIRTNSRTFVAPDPNVPLPPFALNMSLANQSGPQRVLLNADGSRGPIVGETEDPDEARLTTLNRTGSALLKRSRADMGSDVEQEGAGNYKRHRTQEEAYTQRSKSITSLSSSPPTRSIISRHHTHSPDAGVVHDPLPPYQHQHQHQHQQRPMTPLDNELHHRRAGGYYHEQQDDDGPPAPGALDKLLGHD
ncbi:hypothetical protein DXG03_003995, partial [Asterophora parasitica]